MHDGANGRKWRVLTTAQDDGTWGDHRPPGRDCRAGSAVGFVIATTLGMVCLSAWGQEIPRVAAAPELARLESTVRVLSSAEYEGRSGEGGRKAAGYLVEAFRGLGLEPLFEGQFVQVIPGAELGTVQGRNVGAVLRGSDPEKQNEWVILSAHYDHLGVRGGVLYPGADDNASGVAMMLEVARLLASAPDRPPRSIMFLGFDLEEAGLFGSRYFVAHPPVPLDRLVLFVTADMIGRSLAGVCQRRVFVMGTEHAPELRPWIEEAAGGKDVEVSLLGADLLLLNRSDYGPFRSRQIPFLFFSTGENPRYHTPDDTPDTLDYPKLAAISQVILDVVAKAATHPDPPRWRATPEHSLSETLAIRDVLRELIDHRRELGLGAAKLYLMTSTLRSIEAIVARGAVSAAERDWVIQAARIILLAIR